MVEAAVNVSDGMEENVKRSLYAGNYGSQYQFQFYYVDDCYICVQNGY